MSLLPTLNATIKGAHICLDAFRLYETVKVFNNTHPQDDNKWIARVNLGNRIVILSLNACEVGALAAGFKNSTLEKIKSGECFARGLNIPMSLIEAVEQGDPILEKGLIGPVAAFFNAVLQKGIYTEQSYLDLPPEEQAKPTRPIITWDDDQEEYVISGYRPIDPAECKENIEHFQIAMQVATVVRVPTEIKLVSNAATLCQTLCHSLINILRTKYRDYIIKEYQRVNANPLGNDEPHPLLCLPEIPDPLHNDVVLQQYMCPITHMPIRHPVMDPNGRTLYEKQAIIDWLKTHPRSPVTGRPLLSHQLIPVPAVQALINARLEDHEKKLWDYVETSTLLAQDLNAPADANLQMEADNEYTP